MSSYIALKKSSVEGKVPSTEDLGYGELALNYSDGLLYYKNSSNNIKSFSTGIKVGTITGNTTNSLITEVKSLLFDVDSGFDLTNLSNGIVKIGMNSTFKTWKVTGQTDLVANGLDTIRFIAGSGVTITTDPVAVIKSITISSSTVIPAFGNVDGGGPSSVYGGIIGIDGGYV